MHSLPNETMPVLQYSREDNRLSCAATDRKKRRTSLRIAAINRRSFAFVVSPSDDNFQFTVPIQIEYRDYFIRVWRVEAIFLSYVSFWVKLAFDQLRFHFSCDHATQQHHGITASRRPHRHAIVFT